MGFLRNAILTLGLVGCASTEAEKFYNDFPTNIPNILEIQKYQTESFEHCLVQIANMHYVRDMSESEKNVLRDYQRDVTSILRHLDEKFDIDVVYKEGLTVGSDLNDYLRRASSLNDRCQKDLLELKKMQEEGFQFISMTISQNGGKSLEEIAEITSLVYGPAERLAVDGLFELKSSETVDSFYIGMGNKNQINSYDILDGRENIVLNVLAEDNNPFYFLVFGAVHDFSNNVDEWNENHPEKRFAYITIYPSSYNDAVELLRKGL